MKVSGQLPTDLAYMPCKPRWYVYNHDLCHYLLAQELYADQQLCFVCVADFDLQTNEEQSHQMLLSCHTWHNFILPCQVCLTADYTMSIFASLASCRVAA